MAQSDIRTSSFSVTVRAMSRLSRTCVLASVAAVLGLAGAVRAAESPEAWYADAARQVAERRQVTGAAPAKNLVLFVGDGMSLATVAAARILAGQLRGESGERNRLHFERFPYTALASTFNTDRQTPDSAGTMTAMATGVRSFAGAIRVDQRARRGDCASMAGSERVSLIDLAVHAGLRTGIVTTTRITHATTAALYAHSVDREWETDRGIPPSQRDGGCRDIARQLVEYPVGVIDVVLGGGRRAFVPTGKSDPEDANARGHRGDDRDLIERWQERHASGRYVWNRAQFDALPDQLGGPLLGLFESSHMRYEHDRPEDPAGEPSLAGMTAKALRLLGHGERGFVLVVEGGRIDHAHHANNAWRALTDTIAFAEAVRVADEMTGDDTLIIVTADHGHALTFGGYGRRGNPVMGLAERPGPQPREERLMRDDKGRPITVLGYANGPGYRGGERPDFGTIDPRDPDYRQESAVGLWSATHSGEDVPVYARGAGAEVIHGAIDQHMIFHVMVQAMPPLAQVAAALVNEQGLPDWRRLMCRVQDDSDQDC